VSLVPEPAITGTVTARATAARAVCAPSRSESAFAGGAGHEEPVTPVVDQIAGESHRPADVKPPSASNGSPWRSPLRRPSGALAAVTMVAALSRIES